MNSPAAIPPPPTQRTDEQSNRYIWLVKKFCSLNWDNARLHDALPFQVVDPGFDAILIRSSEEVADLAARLDMPEIAAESRDMADNGIAAMETLWKAQAYPT